MNIANLRAALGAVTWVLMIRDTLYAKTVKFHIKRRSKKKIFGALRAPYALAKCKEVQAARF